MTSIMTPLFLLLFFSIHYSESFQPFYPPSEASNPDTRVNLSIALLMSFGGAFNSSGAVPGIQVALDLINNDTDLLPGYRLGYQLMDSQCSHSIALKSYFQQVLYGTPKVALMGSGCSLATEPTADISHFYNLTQVSCASSSSELADRVRFMSYFQMLPTEIDLASGFVSVCIQNGWRHLSIISQNENIFINTINRLKVLLPQYNITLHIASFDTDDGPLSLGNALFEERARIFFLAMYAPMARKVLCKAHEEGRLYPRYTYLTYGWYTSQWLIGNDTSCSQSDLNAIVEYSLAVTQYPDTANKSYVTDAGITHDDFFKLYDERRKELGYSYLINSEHCFDGMWSIAFALNQTINELNSNATLNRLAAEAQELNSFKIEDFTYKNNIVKDIMFKYLSRTSFIGVTGPVSFTSDGIRTVKRLRVLQYRNGTLQEIAAIIVNQDNSLQFNYIENESDATVWPLGVPYDGVATNVTVSVSISITVIYSLLAGCGIGFTVVCLIFNIFFRKNKLIRLSSPKLNYFIIAGAIIMYMSVIVYTLPSESELGNTVLCNLKPRLFSLGYSLCFGTILAKMWRVYYIFTNPNMKKKSGIKDWHLSLFVLVVMIIDLLLITIPTAFEDARNTAKLIERKENPSDEEGALGYRTDYYTYICESRGRDIWLGVLYGFKGVLQVAALFLAFGTRRVKVKGLNESKFVAAIIYITSVVLAIKIIAAITLNEYVNVFSFLFATCILITATTTLGLIFIPQMIGLYRDPTGANIFYRESAAPSSAAAVAATETFKTMSLTGEKEVEISNDPFLSDKEKIEMLTKKIKELEKNSNEVNEIERENKEPENKCR